MAALADLSVGDRVALDSDPTLEQGTVAEIEAGRVFVVWDRGRTWIYAARQLVRVS